MTEFDLRTEPWIPVTHLDGKRSEMGLCEVLLTAHELRSIDDPLPTVEFGLYRLMTAVVLDIFEIKGVTALAKLIDKGEFDAKKVEDYFEKHSDSFDLFHEKHPFLQVPDMEKDNPKPLAGLLPAIPSGTNASHFHHGLESEFGVSPAAAARLLTLIAPFMTAGGAGLSPSINGAPPWYVLLSRSGGTLFETLCLNICAIEQSQAEGAELPAWRNPRPITSERLKKTSLLESLTWQPRRIQLISGAAGICSLTCKPSDVIVRTMKFAPGHASGFEPIWLDPAVPYRISKEGPLAMRPQEGRAVWRDTGPIALLKDGTQTHRRPTLIDQFSSLVARQAFEKTPQISLTLYGMRTDMKMKVFEWQRERLVLPIELLWGKRNHQTALEAMENAEAVAYSLRLAIKHTYPREGKGNSKAFDTLIANASQQYWSDLRHPYEDLLRQVASLSPESDREELAQCDADWQSAVREAGWEALNASIDNLDSDAEALKRLVEARSRFRNGLKKAFMTPEEKQQAAIKMKSRKGEKTG